MILISAFDDPVVISLSAIVIALPVVTNDAAVTEVVDVNALLVNNPDDGL